MATRQKYAIIAGGNAVYGRGRTAIITYIIKKRK